MRVPADVEQGVGLIARERGAIVRARVAAGGELGGAVLAQRMALEKFGAGREALLLLLRQPFEQGRGGHRRDGGALEHLDGVGIRLGLVGAGVAERDQLLGVRADVAGEQSDERADPELADQRLGHVAAADVRDFVRQDARERLGIGLGDRRPEHDDIAARQRGGVEHRHVERRDLDRVRAGRRAGRNPLHHRFERLLALGVAAAKVAEIADDRAADIALPAHRHMRREPVRRDIAERDHRRGQRPGDEHRRNQPDAVDPAAVALLPPEQRRNRFGRFGGKHQPPAGDIAPAQSKARRPAFDALEEVGLDLLAPAAALGENQAILGGLHLNVVRVGGDSVVEPSLDQIAPTSNASAKPSASRGAWVVDWVSCETSTVP